jgi:hypothetical protein
MTNYMKPTAAQFYTADYGKKYAAPIPAKISRKLLAEDKDGNVIEKDGYVYFTTNPEKYVSYKEDNQNNEDFNWLWTGGGYSTNPENHIPTGDYWKLDKYNNVMGKDLYVSYKVLVPRKNLQIV